MKRFALTLVAIALTGAMAFAQEAAPVVKLSGYVNAGIKYEKVDSADATVKSNADDFGADAVAGKVTAAVTGSNYGASVTVKSTDVAGTTALDTAKVYFVPMTGLTAFVGTGYSDAFDGLDDISNDYFWAANGYGLTYATNGVTVGAQAGGTGKNLNYGLGAAYALPKVAEVRVSAKTNGNAFSAYEVSGNMSVVDKLSLNAGFVSTSVDTSAVNEATAAVSYAITPTFSAGIIAHDALTAEYLTIKPNVSYTVIPNVVLTAYYQRYTEGKDAKANAVENELKGQVAWTVGTGTLSGWVDYKTEKKDLVLYTQYILSF